MFITKILLQHHTDVNKSYSDIHMCGALNQVLNKVYRWTDTELVRILLKAGAMVHSDAILHAIRRNYAGNVELVMYTHAGAHHTEWSAKGVFQDTIGSLDSEIVIRIINIMSSNSADINYYVQSSSSKAKTVVDAAAKHGNLDLVRKLLGSGASLTQDTLTYAIQSQSAELISFLLEHGASPESVTSFGSSPLAEAVRTNNINLRRSLVKQGVYRRIKEESQLKMIMEAASKVGDSELVRKLILIGAKT